ncbi:MAG: nitrous oxide reductase family maturation protein NosD [Parafilimonas sp.]
MLKLFFILPILFLANYSFSSVIQVGKNKSFHSIHAALQKANNGDTIFVDGGVYAEGEIKIIKSIKLIGKNLPIIDAQKKWQAISVYVNNVLIEGFEVRNSGYSSMYDWAGIKLVQCDSCTIQNNILTNNNFGIYLQASTNCIIANNKINSNITDEMLSGNAIHCWKSSYITIKNNNVSGHRDGIYFEFVTNSIIQNNYSHNNIRYGLHFMFSHNNSFIKNIFQKNPSGIAVMYSHGVTMTGNRFEENWGSAAYGILMKDISDSHVIHNIFRSNTMAIYLEGASRILIEKNQFISNGYAMRVLANCNDNTIKQNNFISNSFDISTNGTMQLNVYKNNYWDKYEGYDLDRNGIGDVPYRPVSMYSMVIEQSPAALMLLRSFLVNLLDKTEKVVPAIIPEGLIDNKPLMKKIAL